MFAIIFLFIIGAIIVIYCLYYEYNNASTKKRNKKSNSISQAENTTSLEKKKTISSMFSGYRFVSAIDEKTCLICGSLDGKVFKTQEEAQTHKCLNEHCRCVILPEIKGMEGFDKDDTRASVDGPIPAKMTYSKWLKKQPAARKKEILGEYYKQYRNGVTLEEIAEQALKTSEN